MKALTLIPALLLILFASCEKRKDVKIKYTVDCAECIVSLSILEIGDTKAAMFFEDANALSDQGEVSTSDQVLARFSGSAVREFSHDIPKEYSVVLDVRTDEDNPLGANNTATLWVNGDKVDTQTGHDIQIIRD